MMVTRPPMPAPPFGKRRAWSSATPICSTPGFCPITPCGPSSFATCNLWCSTRCTSTGACLAHTWPMCWRRLQRIAHFYDASPRFVLTSATIANPAELGERLIEAPVAVGGGGRRGPGSQAFSHLQPAHRGPRSRVAAQCTGRECSAGPGASARQGANHCLWASAAHRRVVAQLFARGGPPLGPPCQGGS